MNALSIGYTLSQRGLAEHLYISVGWVRRQGELVTRHGETWARMEYSDGRCAGYKLVTKTPVRSAMSDKCATGQSW